MANCENDKCTHYVSKNALRLYKNKFLLSVMAIIVIIVVLFICEVCSYRSSLQSIVDNHSAFVVSFEKTIEPLSVSKDSCVYANDQLVSSMREYMQTTQSVLELQSNKIQADFALLSLWAGILMIVFLIFSIYSMFKTDELMKQGREGLMAIEASKVKADEQVETIDQKVKGEIAKVGEASKKEIDKISLEAGTAIGELKQSIEQERDNFSQIVEQKTKNFQTIHDEYVDKLNKATEETNKLIKVLIDAVANTHIQQTDQSAEQSDNS